MTNRVICKGTYFLSLLCFQCIFFIWPVQASLRYEVKQTQAGDRFIIVSGTFDLDDHLDDFIVLVKDQNPVAIVFDSPGGNVLKAIELGRLIHSLKLATLQTRASNCASACSLAFLGGVLRYAEPGSIGVHKSSFSDTTGMQVEDTGEAVQQLTADVVTYMIEMNVDPALLQLSLKYDSNDIRYLSGSEMKQYRVTMNVNYSSIDHYTENVPLPLLIGFVSSPITQSKLNSTF